MNSIPPTHRILTIDGSKYVLDASISDADAMLVLGTLSLGITPIRTGYIPEAATEYGPELIYTKGEPIEVGLTITRNELVTEPEFVARREAGRKLFDEASAARGKSVITAAAA